ncbi:MAG TPA: hypothetical protein VFH78_11910 [Candidatus Thermoplasmatota archaeon]|nr:hypothetical protein [Candidatus Thermoplasmatota archaeon]
MTPLVVGALLFAACSVACVALLWNGRARAARRVAAGQLALVAAAWLLLARGSLFDATRFGELALLAVAGAAPALATLLLAGRATGPRRGLAAVACLAALPVLALGLAWFGGGIGSGGALSLVLPLALAAHTLATLAAGARAVAPTARSP